jgi:hypothetical protein
MKKILMGLGLVFAGILVVGVIGFGILSYFGSGLDKESKMFVDQKIPIIASSWNPQELVNVASPELLQVAPADKIEALFGVFSQRLGPMQGYKGSRGEAKLFFGPQGKTTTAEYVADAEFEKGTATVIMRTILRNGQWQVLEFRVNSPLLIP